MTKSALSGDRKILTIQHRSLLSARSVRDRQRERLSSRPLSSRSPEYFYLSSAFKGHLHAPCPSDFKYY
ncbi:hypothetical protein HC766_09190 [Candidatus Gracilibacteria bacterium]|nr:hypothetical protein [Candidatus Gracilibacteria bacterium]